MNPLSEPLTPCQPHMQVLLIKVAGPSAAQLTKRGAFGVWQEGLVIRVSPGNRRFRAAARRRLFGL